MGGLLHLVQRGGAWAGSLLVKFIVRCFVLFFYRRKEGKKDNTLVIDGMGRLLH